MGLELEQVSEAQIESLAESLKPRLDALVVCLSHSWGGLEQVAVHDAQDLAKLDLKVRFLCYRDSPIHRQLLQAPFQAVPIDFNPRNYLDFGLKKLLQGLEDSGVNLIHVHQPSLLGSIVPWVWKHKHTALFATRHIMNNHLKKDPIHRAIYHRLDSLIVMSHTLRKNVLATHGISRSKVQVVNLGLDFELFDPERVNPEEERAKWGADSETMVIGLVGRIDPEKGQAAFIRAAAGLTKSMRQGEKFKFVIVGEETLGSTGNYLNELKEMVRQFRLDDQVVFAGFQENIPEVMRAFDIFVMPSRQEAFGLVAIEAMAMECPILISSGGSAEEIVGNDEFGYTIRPMDAFDLQTKLRQLLDSPRLRIEMGHRGREHVKKQYDKRVRVKRTLELYEDALNRRS